MFILIKEEPSILLMLNGGSPAGLLLLTSRQEFFFVEYVIWITSTGYILLMDPYLNFSILSLSSVSYQGIVRAILSVIISFLVPMIFICIYLPHWKQILIAIETIRRNNIKDRDKGIVQEIIEN